MQNTYEAFVVSDFVPITGTITYIGHDVYGINAPGFSVNSNMYTLVVTGIK